MPTQSTDDLEVTSQDDGSLVVKGELDAGSAPILEAVIASDDWADGLVLDTADVTFVDSRGLRCLILGAQEHAITLRNPSANLRRLLELAGVLDLFTIE